MGHYNYSLDISQQGWACVYVLGNESAPQVTLTCLPSSCMYDECVCKVLFPLHSNRVGTRFFLDLNPTQHLPGSVRVFPRIGSELWLQG